MANMHGHRSRGLVGQSVWMLSAAAALFLPFGTCARAAEDRLTDAYASEGVENWSKRYVPSFATSTDAKVGAHSLTGEFGRTWRVDLLAPKTRPWNLTYFEKLRFWAKADIPSKNFLVMLCTKGFENRRDALVELTTEWKQYELPFDESTFFKNVQGNCIFTRVRNIAFYNNDQTTRQIWLDGIEFAGSREGRTPEIKALQAPADGSASLFRVAAIDPFPHLAQAEADREELDPRYDRPPVAFNRGNAFPDPLVNFDAAQDWEAVVHDANGYMCLSDDQSLRGVPNLKIELVPTGKQPRVVLQPPEPVKIDQAFDVVECWVYGGKQGGSIAFQFRAADGNPFAVGTDYSDTADDVNPKSVGQFWNLLRIILPEEAKPGATLVAIHLTPTLSERYKDPTAVFHLDQLRVQLFSKYMKRPAPVFEHVGQVVDNFPTDPAGARPETAEAVETAVVRDGSSYTFLYRPRQGPEIRYLYTPETGTLSDLLVVTPEGNRFHPAQESGPVLDFGRESYRVAPDSGLTAELVSQELLEDRLTVSWKYAVGEDSQTIGYTLSLHGKTLQIDAKTEGRRVSEWKFGYAKGIRDARIIELPFMLYCPNVLLTHGLFVSYYNDWYVGNASMFPYGGDTRIKDDMAWYNWRSDQKFAYYQRTDGRRHPFRERFYITASTDFDDVMITVRNPPSPHRDILRRRLFRMILASSKGIFGKTRGLVDLCAEYGMNDLYVLFHAALFFRRRGASEAFPGGMNVSAVHSAEGGDEGLRDLFSHMRDLGMSPGYYDGYPARDFTAPNFHYDWTSYRPDGNWMRMWRCVGLKPWAFPELAATLYRERARKFGARVSYQDGMTSWIITGMNDYDHRFPESGTVRGTLKALATGWQRTRENVEGPVFSEGRGSDFFHAGLNDGDYSKLKGYWDDKDCTEDRVRLLVNFRLKKMGPLSAPVSVNIGYAAFAGTNKIHYESWYSREESYRYLHHFLAAEIAFATIGMLEPYWPIWSNPKMHFDKTMTSYFMIRQLQERYIMEPVAEIAYFDGEQMLSTSDALRADIVKDNRLRIRYRNGLTLHINLNWDEKHWPVQDGDTRHDLPPGGWLARQGDELLEFSAVINGNRVDYVDSPDFVYLDGHGKRVTVAGHTAENQLVLWKTGPKAGKTLLFPVKQ